MLITLLGQTDKRPVLYTFMKMCEYLGDVAVLSNDRKLMRLMEEGPGSEGTYRNIDVFVNDATADDMWALINRAPNDFEFLFLDNIYPDNADAVIYIKGAGVDEEDQMVLDAFEPSELITIKMGKADPTPKAPKNAKDKKVVEKPKVYNIPYTSDMMANIEHCEFFKDLVPASSQAVKVCAEVLSVLTNTPVKTLIQVANRNGQKGAAKK